METDPPSDSNHGMGNVVILEHPALGIFTLYAHLDKILVDEGAPIDKVGTPIGVIGDTGGDDYPIHLHFEVKDTPTLESQSEAIDAFYWGYTPGHPDYYHYHDPLYFINESMVLESIPDLLLANTAPEATIDLRNTPGLYYVDSTPTEVIGHIGGSQRVVGRRRTEIDGAWWYFVDLPSRNEPYDSQHPNNGPHGGWVSLGDVTPVDSTGLVEVIGEVNVRSEASTSYPIVGRLYAGQRFVSFGTPEPSLDPACGSSWHQIHLPGNYVTAANSGWACGDFLTILPGSFTSFTMRFIDSRTHGPVEGAMVEWGPHGPEETDAEGIVLFFDVPCGPHTLRVTKKGYLPYEEEYAPPCGQSDEQDRGCAPDLPCANNRAAIGEPRFNVGDAVRVFNTGIGLRAWQHECTGNYTVKPDGTTGIIQEGPRCCGGHVRWRIRYADESVDRWSAEGDPDTGEFWLWKLADSAPPQGSIVGWGGVIVGVDLSHGFRIPSPSTRYHAIAAAGSGLHSLALKDDGSVVAWGANAYGACDVPAPNMDFVSVAAGYFHSMGLKADGSIVAWGCRSDGRGIVNVGQCDVPSTSFASVSAGGSHSLGLRADGSIMAWGSNWSGQCNVPADGGFTAIAAGGSHSLGLKSDGSIVSWGGFSWEGEDEYPSPPLGAGFVAIAAGVGHSLALKSDGSVVAWGCGYRFDDEGECGVPAPNSDFVAIAAGYLSSVGLKADGSIVVWGSNWYGLHDVPLPNASFAAVATGAVSVLGLKTDGSIVPWGIGHFAQNNIPAPNAGFTGVNARLGVRADGAIVTWDSTNLDIPSPNGGFVSVSAGYRHNLALRADGTIAAWGCDPNPLYNYGECHVPSPNGKFVAVSAGGWHSLGLKNDSVIVAWGCGSSRDYGQCNVPTPSTGFIALAAGEEHSLGLLSDGSVVTWGCGPISGNAACEIPTPNAEFKAIAAGRSHNLALKADGSVVAWGVCAGLGGDTECAVPNPNIGFVDIAAGAWHSLGLKTDGSIVAWGCDNPDDFGQCDVPAPNAGFVAIAAGGNRSVGIRLRPGDFEGNGKVDESDHREFLHRLAGPAIEPEMPDWRWFDYNDDRRVDLADFRLAQNSFTGP